MNALRFLADQYEQSQRLRIETGERIRAVLQGRDETWPTDGSFAHPHPKPKKKKEELKKKPKLPKCAECDVILRQIRAGKTMGPVPIMGTSYRRHYEAERAAYKEMRGFLDVHPVWWPWLSRIKGVGDTLACKLLGRLDVRVADTPSAFWSYCGLATVPATLYRCPVCKLEKAFPPDFNVTGKHLALNSGTECKAALKVVGEGRCAQPKPRRGEKARYDRKAKTICFLIGMQFLKAPDSKYGRVYEREVARLESERPGWTKGRRHMAALRKMEKLFLSHLWLVWRKVEGLPMTQPYAQAEMGHDGYIDPMEMVEE